LVGLSAAVLIVSSALMADPAGGLEVKVCALVTAHAAGWQEIAPDARIDEGRISFKKKAFLKGKGPIATAREAQKALREALAGLSPGDRKVTGKVLDAVGEWARLGLEETAGLEGSPQTWRDSTAVLTERKGNSFEVARALAAMVRAAGIPARPSFNGVPVICVYITPARKPGYWTVWDPMHPSAAVLRMPVMWLPIDAGEVPLVETEPEGLASRVFARGRRYEEKDEALKAYEMLRTDGVFPEDGEEAFLSAESKQWWEVWEIGAEFDSAPPGEFSVSMVVPFVPEIDYGTRDKAVWISDSTRSFRALPHSETNTRLGGLVYTMKVRVRSAAGGSRGDG